MVLHIPSSFELSFFKPRVTAYLAGTCFNAFMSCFCFTAEKPFAWEGVYDLNIGVYNDGRGRRATGTSGFAFLFAFSRYTLCWHGPELGIGKSDKMVWQAFNIDA